MDRKINDSVLRPKLEPPAFFFVFLSESRNWEKVGTGARAGTLKSELELEQAQLPLAQTQKYMFQI